MRALLGQPLGVAAAGVARAVERRSGERVVHAHSTLPSVGIRSALLTLALRVDARRARPRPRPQVGIGDQHPAAYADPRLRALDLAGRADDRPVGRRDLAAGEGRRVAGGERAAGMAPHVAFEHLSSDRCPGSPCVLPSRGRSTAPP